LRLRKLKPLLAYQDEQHTLPERRTGHLEDSKTPPKLDLRCQDIYPRSVPHINRGKWAYLSAMLRLLQHPKPTVEEIECPEVALTFMPMTRYPDLLVKMGLE
jgi:hypothetical protein